MAFNEMTLRAEIAKVWGEHGAHMDVYDELLRRARSNRNDIVVNVQASETPSGTDHLRMARLTQQQQQQPPRRAR